LLGSGLAWYIPGPIQKAVEVVYENGVIKPLERLDLEESRHLVLLLLKVVQEYPQEDCRYLVVQG
jgi:predicted DNA-binding antitoxin AbrB/MazE fold protein